MKVFDCTGLVAVVGKPANGGDDGTKLSPEWLMDPKGNALTGVSANEGVALGYWCTGRVFEHRRQHHHALCRTFLGPGGLPGVDRAFVRRRARAGATPRNPPTTGVGILLGGRRKPIGALTITTREERLLRRARTAGWVGDETEV